MKKIVITFLLFAFVSSTEATTIIPGRNPLASDMMIPLMGTSYSISLAAFVKLTPRDYKNITGKNLNFFDKIKLKISQRYGKKFIQKDGTIDAVKIQKKFGFFDKWQWHWGGFALGFFLILGPIIALFFKDEYKWDRFWTSMIIASSLILGLSTLISEGIF